MQIVGGLWRGRRLVAPAGLATRPTADRVRQAMFDRLMHAPWAGRAGVEGAHVLDAFAGSGAMGLEALSRGAARATFIERDRAALAAIRANVAACGAEGMCRVVAADVLRAAGSGVAEEACGLVFLDPPYGTGLVGPAVAALRGKGWLAGGALVVAEVGAGEEVPEVGEVLASFTAGAAAVWVFRC